MRERAGSKGDCGHVNAIGGRNFVPTGEAFWQHFEKFYDPATGKRRLTCISRTAVPENPKQWSRSDECAFLPHV